MEWRRIVNVLVMSGMVAVAGSALAQQRPLKQQLIGTWTVVSVADVYPNGKKVDDWGKDVGGAATFDANGNFTWMIIGRNLEAMTGSPRVSARMVIAYYGKYSVDEATRSITFNAVRSTYPNFDNGTRKATFTVSGDSMTQHSTPIATPRGTIVPEVIFKRAK
jgi:hypothetical protein